MRGDSTWSLSRLDGALVSATEGESWRESPPPMKQERKERVSWTRWGGRRQETSRFQVRVVKTASVRDTKCYGLLSLYEAELGVATAVAAPPDGRIVLIPVREEVLGTEISASVLLVAKGNHQNSRNKKERKRSEEGKDFHHESKSWSLPSRAILGFKS